MLTVQLPATSTSLQYWVKCGLQCVERGKQLGKLSSIKSTILEDYIYIYTKRCPAHSDYFKSDTWSITRPVQESTPKAPNSHCLVPCQNCTQSVQRMTY